MTALPLLLAVVAATVKTAAPSQSPEYALCIRVDASTAFAAKAILDMAFPALLARHPHANVVTSAPSSPTSSSSCSTVPEVELALDPAWTNSGETYQVLHTTSSSSNKVNESVVRIVASGRLALGYAVFDLSQHLALFEGASTHSTPSYRAALAGFRAVTRDVYELRTWSEEGQLLDLPDRSYYTDVPPYVNTTLLQAECAALEYELVPALVRLGMNSITILHSDVEDYVTYDALHSFLPGPDPAPVIYNATSPHRVRAKAIAAVMEPWVRHLTEDYGLKIFIQPYEFSAPPNLCAPAGQLNCSLSSPDLLAILQARYTEFHAAIPSLAGIVATVADSWTPRAGYTFVTLWTSTDELGAVATVYHKAIVETVGWQLTFRLWTLGKSVDWATLRDACPKDLELSVKQSNGDFLLDFDINPLLTCSKTQCPPRDRRFMVLVDAFRQYNGWTSAVCYMGSQWGPRLAEAVANGLKDLNVWGSWAPGCTWPDSGTSLGNWTADKGFKSWRGWWDSYRMFNGTATNGGFAFGAQANAYLIARLAQNSTLDPDDIAREFGTIFYGAANAVAVQGVLDASFNAWLQTSYPLRIGDFTLFWTMMQRAYPETFARLVSEGVTVAELQAAQSASAAAVATMKAWAAQVNQESIPSSNPQGYNGLMRGVALSEGYLQAMFPWREAGLRNITLGTRPSQQACADFAATLTNLQQAVTAFDTHFPIESAAWVVGSLDPALYVAPTFLTDTSYRTMADWAAAWHGVHQKVCGGGSV